MEGRIQTFLSMILVVALCATTLSRPVLADMHVTPRLPFTPGSSVDLQKCWSSLFRVEGCVTEIYKSILTGKFENVGPTCCKAFSEVDATCWPKMFPLNPLFPKLLKDGCARISGASSPPKHTMPMLPTIHGFSFPDTPIVDLTKCWSLLFAVEGCVTEIYKSVSTGKFGNIKYMCCNAFRGVDEKCWPQMFPLNPFFPRLLKDNCSRINSTVAAAPTLKY